MTFIVSVIIRKSTGNLNLKELALIMYGTTIAVTIIQALIIPFIYIEKGRIWLFIGIFGIGTLLGIIIKKVKFRISPSLITLLNDYYILILPIPAFICLNVSYTISKNIYLKKEF